MSIFHHPPLRNFAILAAMGRKKPADDERPIFDAIRKPTAPPSRVMGKAKPDEKARPSLRKVKHKQKLTETD